MTPIINISFNTHPISWELIILRLIYSSYSVMKVMFYHQTITGLLKHCTNKINQAALTLCYKEKITTLPKGTTVDTMSLQPGEPI